MKSIKVWKHLEPRELLMLRESFVGIKLPPPKRSSIIYFYPHYHHICDAYDPHLLLEHDIEGHLCAVHEMRGGRTVVVGGGVEIRDALSV